MLSAQLGRLVHRPAPAYLVGTALATWSVGLLGSLLARRGLAGHGGSWLARPILFVLPMPHVVGPSRQTVVWVAIGVGMIAFWLVVHFIEKDTPAAALTVAVIAGLMVGGNAANNSELAAFGAVFDFIGIPTAGVFSLGDLSMNLGIALLPVAAVQAFQDRPPILRAFIGIAVVISNVLFGLWNQPGGLLIIYLVAPVVLVGGLTWLLKGHASRSVTSAS